MITPTPIRFIFKNGIIAGLIQMTIYLTGVYTGLYAHTWMGVLNYLIPFLYILLMLFRYRAALPGATLSFSMAYRISFFTTMLNTVLFSLLSFCYLNYVNPGLIDEQMDLVLQAYEEQGMDEEVYTKNIGFARKMMTSFWFSVPTAVFFGAVINAIVCLIMAAVIKKENEDPFEEVTES